MCTWLNWVITGSGNGSVPDGTQPLPEPMSLLLSIRPSGRHFRDFFPNCKHFHSRKLIWKCSHNKLSWQIFIVTVYDFSTLACRGVYRWKIRASAWSGWHQAVDPEDGATKDIPAWAQGNRGNGWKRCDMLIFLSSRANETPILPHLQACRKAIQISTNNAS